MTKPITPQEAIELHGKNIPDFVINAFNELIAKNIDASGQAIILNSDVRELIEVKGQVEYVPSEWLDIEHLFETSGWTVTFHKANIGENFKSFFKFVANKTS